MSTFTPRILLPLMMVALGLSSPHLPAATPISFSGYSWSVRSGQGGPGPNAWDSRNVWLDAEGRLHLKIARRDGQWSCAEVTLQQRLGFGRYQFEVEGPIDQFDPNIVLGLFNYPTRDVGGDATHEIDIEIARWGNPAFPNGNYVVWPVDPSLKQIANTFEFALTGSGSTHRFDWNPSRVVFQSLQGFIRDNQEGAEFGRWTFEPKDAPRRLAQKPMPVHLNLWLFQGRPPTDNKEVEVVIRRFSFAPIHSKSP
jgi:hypothetical protein